MLDPQSLDHLDRVSEGLPGPFSSRQGLGHVFAITEKSLLSHGWDSAQTDALLGRLLPANLVHPWVRATPYRTRYADPSKNQRVLVFAPIGADQAAQPDVQEAFRHDVEAIRDLLATMGFITPPPQEIEAAQPAVLYPSRYRPTGHKTDVATHKQGNGRRITQEDATTIRTQVSATLGTAAARLKTRFTVDNRHTKTQSAHHEDKTESAHTQKYVFTGLENTAAVLSHLKERLGLRSPAELAMGTTEDDLRARSWAEHHPEKSGAPTEGMAAFYQDLRVTSVRLAQMAGLLLAQDQSVTKDWKGTLIRDAALRGYVQEPLESLIRTAGSINWETRPYREMAFHLLIYAALYQGAARRTEQWITSRYEQALRDRVQNNPAQKVPALIVLYDKGTALSLKQWRPITSQDLAPNGKEGGTTPVPPFPMFWRKPEPGEDTLATWAMVPEALLDDHGGWCTPDPAYKNSVDCLDYQPAHTPDKALASLRCESSRLAEICTIEAVLRALQTAQTEPVASGTRASDRVSSAARGREGEGVDFRSGPH